MPLRDILRPRFIKQNFLVSIGDTYYSQYLLWDLLLCFDESDLTDLSDRQESRDVASLYACRIISNPPSFSSRRFRSEDDPDLPLRNLSYWSRSNFLITKMITDFENLHLLRSSRYRLAFSFCLSASKRHCSHFLASFFWVFQNDIIENDRLLFSLSDDGF